MNDTQSAIKGYIDGIEGDELVGWFYCAESEDTTLTLLVNDEAALGRDSIQCNVPRPDLTDVIGHPVDCGFRVKLEGLSDDKVYRISVAHDRMEFYFHDECLNYCPLVAIHAPWLRQIFMPEYYRYRYHHESLANEEAFSHYLQFGIYADLNPNPWLDTQYIREQHSQVLSCCELPVLAFFLTESERDTDPSDLFHTRFYHDEYPDVRSESSLLAHFVQFGHLEGRVSRKLTLHDSVRREIGLLSRVEPDLRHVGDKINTIVRYPQLRIETFIPRLIKRRFPNRPEVVVCVPFLSHGGADLIATFMLTALEQRYGVDNVIMIVTDRCEHSVSSWTDDSSNILFLDESQRVFGQANRIDLLHTVIGCLSPKTVVNANSHAAWGMYVHYGKQLSCSMDLTACLFCLDYNKEGLVGGYIRDHLPRSLTYVKRLYCDNATVIEDVKAMFGFADEQMDKFHTIYVPVPNGVTTIPDDNFARPDKPILWIGRLARQKRPELLLDIAALMRNQSFVVYGPEGDSPHAETLMSNAIDNIDYRGVYDRFEHLDLTEYSMLLNTSAWEGLPTVLIQVLATGLPVVTSKAGGISELIDESTGWLVPDDHDPESYYTQIRQMYIHRGAALKRSANGIGRTQHRHNWDAFMTQLEKAGCFSDREKPTKSRVIELPRLLAS